MTYFMWLNGLVESTWEGKRPVNEEGMQLYYGVYAGLTVNQRCKVYFWVGG